MPVARDFVAGGVDLCQLIRMTIGPPAQDEERCSVLLLCHGVEDSGRRCMSCAHVEHQCNQRLVGVTTGHFGVGVCGCDACWWCRWWWSCGRDGRRERGCYGGR